MWCNITRVMEILRILLLCFLFTLIETTSGTEDCTESKTVCQVRTAIIAGVASVVDAIPHKDYEFEKKNIALLSYTNPETMNFCSKTCSTATSVGDFDRIDQLITNGQLGIEKLKKEHQVDIDNIMLNESQGINVMSSILRDKGTVFQRAVLEFAPLCSDWQIVTPMLSMWCRAHTSMGRFGCCIMPNGQVCWSLHKGANSRTAP